MDWLKSIFGESTEAAYLIAITVGLVLVLLGLFWVFRKIAGGNSIRGTKNRRPRLGVTEATIVDDKRRLVLVRRDNVEHLVLIGGASDVLVERNIVRVQPATGTVEPIRTKIIHDEPVEDETPAQSEIADTHDDVPPRSVSALASGAAATAAVVASVETALSKADEVPADVEFADVGSTDVKPVDDVPADVEEDSEFTAAVANTLAATPKIEDTKLDDTTPQDTTFKDTTFKDMGSIAKGIVKAETEAFEAAGSASGAFKQPADTISNAGNSIKSEADVSIGKAVSATNEAVDTVVGTITSSSEPQETLKEDKPDEAEDVEIKMESISKPDTVVEDAPSKAPTEEPKAPEVVPPFEVAAAVSHKEPANSSDTKPKEGRADDMEDEMQKLLSELAGERRG